MPHIVPSRHSKPMSRPEYHLMSSTSNSYHSASSAKGSAGASGEDSAGSGAVWARAMIGGNPARSVMRRRWRHLLDRVSQISIGIGGVSVIGAILLIFIYLFYEVAPLFSQAKVRQLQEFSLDLMPSRNSAGTDPSAAPLAPRHTDSSAVPPSSSRANPLAAPLAANSTDSAAASPSTSRANPLAAPLAANSTDSSAASLSTSRANPLAAPLAANSTDSSAASLSTSSANPLAAPLAAGNAEPLAMTRAAAATGSDSAATALLAIDEQSEIGMRLSDDGVAHFFRLQDGSTVSRLAVAVPANATITSFALDSEETGRFVFGLSTGQAVVARYGYQTSFVAAPDRSNGGAETGDSRNDAGADDANDRNSRNGIGTSDTNGSNTRNGAGTSDTNSSNSRNGIGTGDTHGSSVSSQAGRAIRIIEPLLEYPFGPQPYNLGTGAALDSVAIRTDGQTMILAGATEAGRVKLLRVSRQTNLFSALYGDEAEQSFEVEAVQLAAPVSELEQMFIDNDRRWLFLISAAGQLRLFDLQAILRAADTVSFTEVVAAGIIPTTGAAANATIGTATNATTHVTTSSGAIVNAIADPATITRIATSGGDVLIDVVSLLEPGVRPTDIRFLLGGVSLLVADSSGEINQWFVVNQDGRPALQQIRRFNSATAAISTLTAEQRRKNFVTADANGTIAIYNTTARRQAFSDRLLQAAPRALAISPRGDALLAETAAGHFIVWEVHNEHPEVSWSALWSRVWYEGYGEPEYIWQSSSASNNFEPKYSLIPLSFGTLKAAFYAMLLATPLAICGAIFTGYFMAPAMRRKIKPLIELMEALPTVVLGFLAGLWLAPFVERNLLGIFSILLVLPLGMLLASLLWFYLPERIRHQVADGWEAALLVPVILGCTWLAFALAAPLEGLLFAGDLRFWLSHELGGGL